MASEPHGPQKLRELFAAACEMDERERERFLDENSAGSLRAEIEMLLHYDREAASNPLWQFSAVHVEALDQATGLALPFNQLGPYQIVSRIGAGGMGAIYLAERDYDDVRRRVAIKIVPGALLDDGMLQRFRQERQILARMEHPNIARMLDAGRTPDGMPYLVMEYIDGIPIDRYVAANRLSDRAKLALFEPVCDAVAFAHRNLVVHRDLKPGNILVTPEGVPKLLDFGIAKLLGEAANADATSAALMTPAYASPEQRAGNPITTASDIYSLGIILYELVAGEKIAIPRKRLPGDTENVVAMALRDEPDRRYASAGELAQDARRAIDGYSVRARSDTLAYRIRRLVTRRPLELGVVAVLAIGLITAAIVAYVQYREAQQRFAEVRNVANSFLFDVYDALADLPGTTEARMLVARRAQQYLDTLARSRSSDPALKRELASAYMRLGDILGRPWTDNLGDTEGALSNYMKADRVFRSIDASGRTDASLFENWSGLYTKELRLALRRGRTDEAVAAGEKAAALMDRAMASRPSRELRLAAIDGHVSLAQALLENAKVEGGVARFERAASEGKAALESARALARSNSGDEAIEFEVAKAAQYLGYIEYDFGWYIGDATSYARIRRLIDEVVAIVRHFYAINPDRYRRRMADCLSDFARITAMMGESKQAVEAGRESVRLFEQIAANDPRNVEALGDLVVAHWSLGKALDSAGHTADATLEFEKALAGHEQIKRQIPNEAGDNKLVVELRDWLAHRRVESGDRRGATSLYRSNVDLLAGSRKVTDIVALALDYELMGDYPRAAELWEKLRRAGQLPPRYSGKPAATPN